MSFTVNFTDQSTPGPSGPITAWEWDFGDGSPVSHQQNPSHAYASPGLYSVDLTVTGSGDDGTDMTTIPVIVIDPLELAAAFTFTASGLAVTFADQSIPGPSGPITDWDWDWGDGTAHGTTQNPSHTYASGGTRTVTLTITGTGADGTSNVSHTVTVASPGTTFETITNFARPSFTPLRTVHFANETQFRNAIVNMQDGDLIQITPGTGKLTITGDGGVSGTIKGGGQLVRLTNHKPPTHGVVIDLGTYSCVQDGSLESSDYTEFHITNPNMKPGYSAFYLQQLENITIYGGSFTGDGHGVLVNGDLTNVKWYDYYVHDVGGGGFYCLPVSPTSNGYTDCFFRGEVTKIGRYPTWDPHADKGTGLHGCIIENGGTDDDIDTVTWIQYAHEIGLQPGESSYGKTWPEGSGGAGSFSLGNDTAGVSKLDNITLYYKVVNGYMKPGFGTNPGSTAVQKDGTVGINLWGSTPLNNLRIGWAEVDGVTGTNIHCAGGNWKNGSIVVDHGRSHNACLYPAGCPAPNNVPYPSGFGIDYNDCRVT